MTGISDIRFHESVRFQQLRNLNFFYLTDQRAKSFKVQFVIPTINVFNSCVRMIRSDREPTAFIVASSNQIASVSINLAALSKNHQFDTSTEVKMKLLLVIVAGTLITLPLTDSCFAAGVCGGGCLPPPPAPICSSGCGSGFGCGESY